MIDLNGKLAKLRVKSGKIYSQLYDKKGTQVNSLAELFEKDMISLDSPKASKYMELIMEVEFIEGQIHELIQKRYLSLTQNPNAKYY